MKKFLLISMAVIAMVLTSCEQKTDFTVITLSAKSLDWVEYTENDSLNRYYACTFGVPEITESVYKEGVVLCYLTLSGAQEILPYVRHYENDMGARWTKTIDFEYFQRGVSIFVTNSDFFKETPEAMTFRLTILSAN